MQLDALLLRHLFEEAVNLRRILLAVALADRRPEHPQRAALVDTKSALYFLFP